MLFKKSDMSYSLMIRSFDSQETKENCSFHRVFDSYAQFFPFLGPRANRSRCSSLHHSFFKSDGCESLSLVFTKERMQMIHYCRSFDHNKQAIRSKNHRANSQPCLEPRETT